MRPYGAKDMSFMDDPCYVYVLMGPWNKRPFYIGISNNPWYRFEAHRQDPCSAVWQVMRLLFDGRELFHRDEILKIYKKCATRAEALEIEYRLVVSTPKLLNRPYVRGRAYT